MDRSLIISEDDIYLLKNKSFGFEKMNIHALYYLVSFTIADTMPLAKKKEQSVSLYKKHKFNENSTVRINKYLLKKAITEILINSYKFSIASLLILVEISVYDEKLIIDAISIPDKRNNIAGIPVEDKNAVLEPLTRLVDVSFPEYETPDQGLGLAVVNNIMQLHQGSISIGNVSNTAQSIDDTHSDYEHEKVMVRLKLPLV